MLGFTGGEPFLYPEFLAALTQRASALRLPFRQADDQRSLASRHRTPPRCPDRASRCRVYWEDRPLGAFCRFPLCPIRSLDTRDRDQFSAKSGQAILIQINQCPIPDIDFAAAPIVRFAARSLFAKPKSLYCRTQAVTWQTTKQPSGGEFRACVQLIRFYSFCYSCPKISPRLMSRTAGRLLPGSVRKMIKKQLRTLIRSVLYINPSSVINLRFFHGQVE